MMTPDDVVISLAGMYDDCKRLGYIVRDKQFFQPTINDLRRLKKEIVIMKEKFIKDKEEENANLMLSCECFVDALIYEMNMWTQLKNEDPNAAWISLVNSQQMVISSLHAKDIQGIDHVDYYKKLETIEKVVFPPQTFMSTGMVVGGTKCTICNDEYEKCDHVSGEAYMGQFCSKQVYDIKKMNEISIVGHPFDKRCRVITTQDDGIASDMMSGKTVKKIK